MITDIYFDENNLRMRYHINNDIRVFFRFTSYNGLTPWLNIYIKGRASMFCDLSRNNNSTVKWYTL